MAYERRKVICQRVRPNNGVTEVLLVRPATATSQEWPILINVENDYGTFEEGREYWFQLQPAFPY